MKKTTKKWLEIISSGILGSVITLITPILFQDKTLNIEKNKNNGQQSIVARTETVSMTNQTNNGVPPELLREVSEKLGETKSELKFVKEQLYFKEQNKIDLFFKEIENTTQEQRNLFEEKSSKSIKETALQLLQPKDDNEKIVMQGIIFKEAILGKLSYDEAIKLSEMINKVYLKDLKEFLNNYNLQINENNQSLVFAGIFKATSGDALRRPRSFGGGIRYIITNEGNLLYKILSQQNNK